MAPATISNNEAKGDFPISQEKILPDKKEEPVRNASMGIGGKHARRILRFEAHGILVA